MRNIRKRSRDSAIIIKIVTESANHPELPSEEERSGPEYDIRKVLPYCEPGQRASQKEVIIAKRAETIIRGAESVTERRRYCKKSLMEGDDEKDTECCSKSRCCLVNSIFCSSHARTQKATKSIYRNSSLSAPASHRQTKVTIVLHVVRHQRKTKQAYSVRAYPGHSQHAHKNKHARIPQRALRKFKRRRHPQLEHTLCICDMQTSEACVYSFIRFVAKRGKGGGHPRRQNIPCICGVRLRKYLHVSL